MSWFCSGRSVLARIQSQCEPGLGARAMAGRGGHLTFQESQNAAYGLAADGFPGLVGDGGCVRERVPGEGRQVRRCLFCEGDAALTARGAPA